MRLTTLWLILLSVVILAAPALALEGVRTATVIEVSANREILIQLDEETDSGEYITVPSTGVFTSSGRHRELPLVGDKCLLTFLDGDKAKPVIFGFCSSSPGEHDSFSNEEDRRTTLPNGGSLYIEGSTGRVSVTLPSNLFLTARGINPGMEIRCNGSLIGRFNDSIIVRSPYLMCTHSKGAHFSFGETTVETENMTYAGKEITVEADVIKLKAGRVVIESGDLELGGIKGEPVARKGDKVVIPKENFNIVDGKVAADAEGEIVEGSDAVKAVTN